MQTRVLLTAAFLGVVCAMTGAREAHALANRFNNRSLSSRKLVDFIAARARTSCQRLQEPASRRATALFVRASQHFAMPTGRHKQVISTIRYRRLAIQMGGS